jgi:outer membrane lipoprotein-sorting protein
MIIFRLILILSALSPGLFGQENAVEIVRKSNDLLRGVSSYSELRMRIEKPDWSREMRLKMWALEPDFGLVFVISPARDKGNVTLKRQTEVWNWLPSVRRVIKIPPSMMLQSWMGSDFTNDDLVRQSSLVEDYEHTIAGVDTLDGYPCWRIDMIPKPDAGVVWGKVIMWIAKEHYWQLKSDFFDEDGTIVKSMRASEIKNLGGRRLPARLEMVPFDEQCNKTIMIYEELEFDIDIKVNFFSQQNMKRIR